MSRHPIVAVVSYLLAIASMVVGVHLAAPSPEQVVRHSAQTALAAWDRGDYGAFHDSWSSYPTSLLGKRDYMAITAETCPPKPCPSATGYLIAGITLHGDRAHVRTVRRFTDREEPVIQYMTLVNEQGQWRYLPDGASLRFMERIHSGELTVEQAIAEIGQPKGCK